MEDDKTAQVVAKLLGHCQKCTIGTEGLELFCGKLLCSSCRMVTLAEWLADHIVTRGEIRQDFLKLS